MLFAFSQQKRASSGTPNCHAQGRFEQRGNCTSHGKLRWIYPRETNRHVVVGRCSGALTDHIQAGKQVQCCSHLQECRRRQHSHCQDSRASSSTWPKAHVSQTQAGGCRIRCKTRQHVCCLAWQQAQLCNKLCKNMRVLGVGMTSYPSARFWYACSATVIFPGGTSASGASAILRPSRTPCTDSEALITHCQLQNPQNPSYKDPGCNDANHSGKSRNVEIHFTFSSRGLFSQDIIRG